MDSFNYVPEINLLFLLFDIFVQYFFLGMTMASVLLRLPLRRGLPLYLLRLPLRRRRLPPELLRLTLELLRLSLELLWWLPLKLLRLPLELLGLSLLKLLGLPLKLLGLPLKLLPLELLRLVLEHQVFLIFNTLWESLNIHFII